MDGLGLTGLSIGLTGGIGSGKSTVARLLVEAGAVLVDTDAISRALTATGGAALPALAAEFGAQMLTAAGALDRDRMRALAFGDAAARARLEAVLHPLIGAEAQRQAAQASWHAVVFDVPLLGPASHWRRRMQRLLVVDCGEETQVRRVVQRSGWTEAAVRSVMAQQLTRAARRTLADAVIFNDGLTLDALALQVRLLWALWNNPAH